MRQGALYSIECMECHHSQDNQKAVYFGETGRTLFDRGAEHLAAHRLRNKESILVAHEENCHEGSMLEWKMAAMGFPEGNLVRPAMEAQNISEAENCLVLNHKGEWGQNLPPQLEAQVPGGNGSHQAQRADRRKRRRVKSPAQASETEAIILQDQQEAG